MCLHGHPLLENNINARLLIKPDQPPLSSYVPRELVEARVDRLAKLLRVERGVRDALALFASTMHAVARAPKAAERSRDVEVRP